jgi:hypothetical protein
MAVHIRRREFITLPGGAAGRVVACCGRQPRQSPQLNLASSQ